MKTNNIEKQCDQDSAVNDSETMKSMEENKDYDSEKENEIGDLEGSVKKSKLGIDVNELMNGETESKLKMNIGEDSNDSQMETGEHEKIESEKNEINKSREINGNDEKVDEETDSVKEKIVYDESKHKSKESREDKLKNDRKDYSDWINSLKNAGSKVEKSNKRPDTPPLQKLMRQEFSPLKSGSAFIPSPKKVKEGFTSKLASVIVPPSPINPRTASHPKQLLSHNVSNLRTSLKSITAPRHYKSSHLLRPSPYPSVKQFIQNDEQPLDLSNKSKKQESTQPKKPSFDTRRKSSHVPKPGNGLSSPLSTSLQSLQQKFGGDFHLRGLQTPTNYMLYGPEIPALHRALLHHPSFSLPHIALSMANDIPKHSRHEHSPGPQPGPSTPSPKSKLEESSKSIKSERSATPEKSSRLDKADIDRLDNSSPVNDDLESKSDKYTNHMCTCGKWFNNLYALSLHLQETGHLPARSKAVSLLEYPKLVRGQDMWLNQESEQTRRILRCIQCGESFKTLPMLTVHMMKTQHYTKIVSSEHTRRTHKCSAYCEREPDKECVFKCKVCQDTFTDMEGLANHMIMSGHHKKQVVRTNPGLPDMGLRSKRKRYYGYEDINPYHPSLAALLDYKRKYLAERGGSPEYSNDNDSDESDNTITCESCGKKIGTKLFVEHVRACVGMKLSDEYYKKEKPEIKVEKETGPGLSAKFALYEKLCKMDGETDHDQEKSSPQESNTASIEKSRATAESFDKRSVSPKDKNSSNMCEKNPLIKRLFDEDNVDKYKPRKESVNMNTDSECSPPIREIHRSEPKKLPSPVNVPSFTPTKSIDIPIKREAQEHLEQSSAASPKSGSSEAKPGHTPKKLDIIDPDNLKEESSGKSALSAMESFIQKSFSNKFDYKKGNIVLSPNSISESSSHSRPLDSSMIPESTLDYLNKYRKFYSALTHQNGFNDNVYNTLKEAGAPSLNGDISKPVEEKKGKVKDRVTSPIANNVNDRDETSSVKSNHSERSMDRNSETLEKKYLDVSDNEETKTEKTKSSALDNLSSFVYGQPMTSEHPLDSLQRLITKTDIPKLMASAGAKTFKYLPPHLQLQASGELPVPLNLSMKGEGQEDSDDEDQMRLDDEALSDCDGATSPTNSDGEPVEYRCAACKRRFASKGSYRYHLSRCHLSSVKQYGIKEAFNMSPYVYLPLDHTARFSKYYEMAKELASKRKQP